MNENVQNESIFNSTLLRIISSLSSFRLLINLMSWYKGVHSAYAVSSRVLSLYIPREQCKRASGNHPYTPVTLPPTYTLHPYPTTLHPNTLTLCYPTPTTPTLHPNTLTPTPTPTTHTLTLISWYPHLYPLPYPQLHPHPSPHPSTPTTQSTILSLIMM